MHFKHSSIILSLLSARGVLFLIAHVLPSSWEVNPVETYFWPRKEGYNNVDITGHYF